MDLKRKTKQKARLRWFIFPLTEFTCGVTEYYPWGNRRAISTGVGGGGWWLGSWKLAPETRGSSLKGVLGASSPRKVWNLEARKWYFQHSQWDISLKKTSSWIRCKMTGTSSAYSMYLKQKHIVGCPTQLRVPCFNVTERGWFLTHDRKYRSTKIHPGLLRNVFL